MTRNGDEKEGKVYKLTLSNQPVPGHNYRFRGGGNVGVNIDDELLSVGMAIIRLLVDNKIEFVTVHEPRKIHDRSWEMSAALAAQHKRPYFATGVVTEYHNGVVTYGPISGLSNKRKTYEGMSLITVN